jgi:asparagine synthase (glutamine-hydrolysing)
MMACALPHIYSWFFEMPMFAKDSSVSFGSPRFKNDQLAQLAASKGDIVAWHQAVSTHTNKAAEGVAGDFAVALRMQDGRAFLAVDRFSICTLCYRIVNGQLWFASTARELIDDSSPIEAQAIFDYLYFHVIPSPHTIYRGIHRLPPGHHALFENGQITVEPYWRPDFEEQHNTSFTALRNEFRSLLSDAVTTQLDGTRPGCFLSGGTDSSTVAGMIARASSQTTSTYSIGFDAQGYDEMSFARLAAKHFNTQHHEYYVTPADLVHSIPDMAAHFDQPFGNSSALPAYYCAKMARDDGISKLLAGDGGDELFGGNTRYAKQRVFEWYAHIPHTLRKTLMEPLLASRAAQEFHWTRKAASYVTQARTPMPDRLQMYNLILRLGLDNVLTPQMLAHIDVTGPLKMQQDVWNTPLGISPLNRELAFDWRFTLAESDLRKVVGASHFAGIEVGFPMLDDRLLSFSLKLPTRHKLRGLQLRWFFKEALRGFLPNEVIRKKKQGFGLPFGVWANTHTALKTLASDSLNGLARRGVVKSPFVHTLLTRRLPEHPGYFGEMIWVLMMLEQWLRAHAPDFEMQD